MAGCTRFSLLAQLSMAIEPEKCYNEIISIFSLMTWGFVPPFLSGKKCKEFNETIFKNLTLIVFSAFEKEVFKPNFHLVKGKKRSYVNFLKKTTYTNF